jgi:radical SAM superfamily enzyme YgiQ (UPF0313 family)
MKIGLIAIAGVKMQTRKFIDLGVTLPQFISRGQVIARLPSLGLLTLAGATPEGVEIEYLEIDDMAACLANPKLDFDLVALSCYTARIVEAYRLADLYRAHGVAVVLGGLHVTVLPGEAALHADAIVVGEAEATWPDLVRDFLREGKEGLKPVYRELKPGHYDLAHAPMPRFDLLTHVPSNTVETVPDPLRSGEIHRLGAYSRVTVQTTRGCPWDCDFCAASKLYGPRYRMKPVDLVLAEIDAVAALWRRPFIEFADDNTFVHKGWSKHLLRELCDRDVRYFTETDVTVADDQELLDLLYPSGCRQLLIGFESPRQASLEGIDAINWKKRQHSRYFDVIEQIQGRGISVCGCFVVGFDADTPGVFDEIRAFVERSRLLEVQITILTPFPGTRLYRRLLEENRLLYPGVWERCTLFDLNFQPKNMTVDELEDGVMALWKDTWNAQAQSERKRYYRQLLRQRRKRAGENDLHESDEMYALPSSRS